MRSPIPISMQHKYCQNGQYITKNAYQLLSHAVLATRHGIWERAASRFLQELIVQVMNTEPRCFKVSSGTY